MDKGFFGRLYPTAHPETGLTEDTLTRMHAFSKLDDAHFFDEVDIELIPVIIRYLQVDSLDLPRNIWDDTDVTAPHYCGCRDYLISPSVSR